MGSKKSPSRAWFEDAESAYTPTSSVIADMLLSRPRASCGLALRDTYYTAWRAYT
jgi:hypothetical protein